MGDLASDYDTLIESIIKEYRKLRTHNPDHELLQYITKVTDQGFEYVRDKSEAFLDRFKTPDKKLEDVKMIKVLASYFVALSDAIDKIEGIDPSPKLNQSVSFTPIKTLEDLPF
jgi:YesN/AraC family two-component response regulator